MEKFRLYIDESGHHRYKPTDNFKERYLGLTGVIITQNEYEENLVPRIERIRKLFYTDFDFRPCLHLTDIMANKNAFSSLQIPEIREEFDKQLLSLLVDVNFQIITIVIDKTVHYERYTTPEHPYHYSLECMLERYCKFLKNTNGRGDVVAESRGKKEDTQLKNAYLQFYDSGSYYALTSDVQSRFTSHEIKLKTKTNLMQGLEFADLLALPSKLDVLFTYNRISSYDQNFTSRVISTIQPKYYSGVTGPKGNGKKFI